MTHLCFIPHVAIVQAPTIIGPLIEISLTFLGQDGFAWTRVNCVAASHINAATVIRV